MEPVGVIVGRFQVPELHSGHQYLINQVMQWNASVLIVVGSAASAPTNVDPLNFSLRSDMIRQTYHDVRIAELKDIPNDAVWVSNLDALLEREFPGRKYILYGSRSSCLSTYKENGGKHPCIDVPTSPCKSAGSEVRTRIAQEALFSAEFRAGVIYGVTNRHPISYQVVDVAIEDPMSQRVLLGRRNHENGKLRFLGGFVDPNDESLEAASAREEGEEIRNIRVINYQYLGSFRVNDWRYKNATDKIMTAFFAGQYCGGEPEASDDIDGVEWVFYHELLGRLIPEHQAMGKKLLARHHERNLT